ADLRLSRQRNSDGAADVNARTVSDNATQCENGRIVAAGSKLADPEHDPGEIELGHEKVPTARARLTSEDATGGTTHVQAGSVSRQAENCLYVRGSELSSPLRFSIRTVFSDEEIIAAGTRLAWKCARRPSRDIQSPVTHGDARSGVVRGGAELPRPH